MKNSISKKRIVISIITLLILFVLIFISWKLSEENGIQSNDLSTKIAQKIEYTLDDHFYINHKDAFWESTLNQLLRKAAHFLEYALIGSVLCLMLNVAINRALPAALISILFSPLLGIIDEYHQRFSPMRTPRILDICIDTAGALTGIIIITLVFLLYNYIRKLKARINELEKQNS